MDKDLLVWLRITLSDNVSCNFLCSKGKSQTSFINTTWEYVMLLCFSSPFTYRPTRDTFGIGQGPCLDLGLQGKTIVQCVSNSISPQFGQIIYWLSVQRQNDSRVHLYRSILTMESTHAASIKSFNCFLWLIYAAVFLIYCQKCKDATTWKSRLI